MSTLELDPEAIERRIPDPSEPMGLGCTVLLANARWFVKLRWIVVGCSSYWDWCPACCRTSCEA